MRITSIRGAMPGYDHNINAISQIVYDTMLEIGEHVDEINLIEANLPYCNQGAPTVTFTTIQNAINESDGIIFVMSSNLFAPSAIMQTFLEYMSMPIYKNSLKNKNCMVIVVSGGASVRSTMDYMSTVITHLGGFDSVKIPLTASTTKNMTEETKELVEKYTEDFYRYVKQGRKFFVHNDTALLSKYSNAVPAGGVFSKQKAKEDNLEEEYSNGGYEALAKKPTADILKEAVRDINVKEEKPQAPTYTTIQKPVANKGTTNFRKSATTSAYTSNIMESFNSAQEDDISEISKVLSSKLSDKVIPTNDFVQEKPQKPLITLSAPKVNNIFNEELVEEPVTKVSPRTPNCKQMTQNLTHYYQPHLADGLVASVQLNISGNESFDGCIKFNGNDCSYSDGNVSNPDVTILASDDTWKQIIKGTISTQRAFMTGQLKVRGNFVLLSKFDILFKR